MDKNQHCYICNCSLPQQSPPSFTCNHTQCTSCLANYLLRSEFKTFSLTETLFLCPCDKGKLPLLPSQLKELFVSKEATLCKKHKNHLSAIARIASYGYAVDAKQLSMMSSSQVIKRVKMSQGKEKNVSCIRTRRLLSIAMNAGKNFVSSARKRRINIRVI